MTVVSRVSDPDPVGPGIFAWIRIRIRFSNFSGSGSGQYQTRSATLVRRGIGISQTPFFYSGLPNRLIALIVTYLNISNNNCKVKKVFFLTLVRACREQLYVNSNPALEYFMSTFPLNSEHKSRGSWCHLTTCWNWNSLHYIGQVSPQHSIYWPTHHQVPWDGSLRRHERIRTPVTGLVWCVIHIFWRPRSKLRLSIQVNSLSLCRTYMRWEFNTKILCLAWWGTKDNNK